MDLLYWDPKRRRPKRAATTTTNPGNLRPLITVVQQLDFNYDLYGMRAEEILRLLPGEFDGWRPGGLFGLISGLSRRRSPVRVPSVTPIQVTDSPPTAGGLISVGDRAPRVVVGMYLLEGLPIDPSQLSDHERRQLF